MAYRPEDLDLLLQEGEDVVFGVLAFKGFWDQASLPQDGGGDLGVMATTEKLTFATAHAPGLGRGSQILVSGEGRRVREVRLVGDGALSEAFLELP